MRWVRVLLPESRVPDNTANPYDVLLVFHARLIALLLGLFRLGFMDVVLSRALLRGFVTAVAIVILVYVSLLYFKYATLFPAALIVAPYSGNN